MMVGTLAVLLLLIPLRGLQMPQNALSLLLLFGIAALGTVLPIFCHKPGHSAHRRRPDVAH